MNEVVELGMWESLVKFQERLHLFVLKIKDHTEVPEEDYTMIKPLCRDIWNGEVMFFKPATEIPVEIVKEQGLFSDNVAENNNGTDVVL